MNIRMKNKWDMGLSYFTCKEKLLNAFRVKHGEYNLKPSPRKAKALTYIATGLLQLANGLRNGEAMLSYRWFLEKDIEKFYIWVHKQRTFKKLKDGRIIDKKEHEWRSRLVIVPKNLIVYKEFLRDWFQKAFPNPNNFIPLEFMNPIYRREHFDDYRRYESKYSKWWITNFRMNPHTFRYAWQNYVLDKIPPELTAKIQGRADLNVLLEYLRDKEAEKYFESIIDF